MRGDRFTVDEMKLIGAVVAQIRAARDSLHEEAQNVDHLGKTDSAL